VAILDGTAAMTLRLPRYDEPAEGPPKADDLTPEYYDKPQVPGHIPIPLAAAWGQGLTQLLSSLQQEV
jgi:hypothetical protein